MLFYEKKSALVRLSDCIKFGIQDCLDATKDLIAFYKEYEAPLRRITAIAIDISEGKLAHKEGEAKIAEESKNMPEENAIGAIALQGRLHAECLSVLLNCCFALESYANSLGYDLLQKRNFLGLPGLRSDAIAEILIDAFEKMRILDKWEALGTLRTDRGFNKSKAPYQDLKILFRFRNDVVHDKVVDYSDQRESKRYNGKLPDPVFGLLDLRHVVYAADTYWGMILEIHAILDIEMTEFHRHYNLGPWFNEGFEKEVRKAAEMYMRLSRGAA